MLRSSKPARLFMLQVRCNEVVDSHVMRFGAQQCSGCSAGWASGASQTLAVAAAWSAGVNTGLPALWVCGALGTHPLTAATLTALLCCFAGCCCLGVLPEA
jgi:hypothetical protein